MAAQTTTSSDDIVFKALEWAHTNRKPLIIGVSVVAVAAIAMGLYNWKEGENERAANAQLLAQPVATDMRVHDSGNALANLAREYPSTTAGEFAAVLAAEDAFVDGNYAEAQRQFSAFLTEHPGSDLSAEAGLGVAASLEAQGKLPEATQQYQQVISANPTELSVIAPAKLTLGRLAEQQKRFDLAFMQYQELARNPNPNDLWAQEARERLQILVGQHPELMKQFAQPTPNSAGAQTIKPIGSAPSGAPAASASNAAPRLLELPNSATSPAPAKH